LEKKLFLKFEDLMVSGYLFFFFSKWKASLSHRIWLLYSWTSFITHIIKGSYWFFSRDYPIKSRCIVLHPRR